MESEGSDKGQDILAVPPRHQRSPHTAAEASLGSARAAADQPCTAKKEKKKHLCVLFKDPLLPEFEGLKGLRGSVGVCRTQLSSRKGRVTPGTSCQKNQIKSKRLSKKSCPSKEMNFPMQ